jgi:hypothetical protein
MVWSLAFTTPDRVFIWRPVERMAFTRAEKDDASLVVVFVKVAGEDPRETSAVA